MHAAVAPAAPVRSGTCERGHGLAARFRRVRDATVDLVRGLAAEDNAIQSMPEASPAKWHLAHTTWFFEQFVLARDGACQPLHPGWEFLFNSYYQTLGPMHARAQRGLLSRVPAVNGRGSLDPFAGTIHSDVS